MVVEILDLEEKLEKDIEEIDGLMQNDTFEPTGEVVGYGCWGVVDKYLDPSGQPWAIKRFRTDSISEQQMKERNLTPEKVMRKEAISLSAANHHIVPRLIERDKRGRLFVGMPVYKETLEDKLKRRNQDTEQTLQWMKDIAEAIHYVNVVERRAHGDLKPSNIFLDKHGRVFVSDLGSSTCISIGSSDPRDNIGDENYRAPECYNQNSHPQESSDVWSEGALFYEFLTGEKIKRNLENLHGLDLTKANKSLKRKLRKVPMKYRKLLRGCLDARTWERFNSTKVKSELQRITEEGNTWKQVKTHVKKWTLPLAIPAALIAITNENISTYEPQDLSMPVGIENRVRGMLYPPGGEYESIEFESESLPLGELNRDNNVFSSVGNERAAKLSTDNRVVAYLVKACDQTQKDRGLIKTRDPVTDFQKEIYFRFKDPKYLKYKESLVGRPRVAWANAIEYALTKSKTPDGKVDLEDTLAISRLGDEKVGFAKRISGSSDWRYYRPAKYSNGKYVIPEREQEFINHWLSYIHTDY